MFFLTYNYFLTDTPYVNYDINGQKMTKTMFKKINFPYEHPLFRKTSKSNGGVYYKDSVYYFWWEFLRRNKEYKKCCESDGKGKLNGLYRDFGDVFNVDFKTWWKTDDRGAFLFGNKLPPEFKIIKEGNEIINDDNVLYLQIPLELPKMEIHKKLKEVLSKSHIGTRGVRTNLIPTAKYPVTHHFYKEKLKQYLLVYDLKIDSPHLKLWEITLKTNLGFESKYNPLDSDSERKRQKTILSTTSKRILEKVNIIIDGTSLGMFPVTKKCDVRNT